MGYIIGENIGLDGKTIVQHHMTVGSSNSKTNNVITVWHTIKGVKTPEAIKSGLDVAVCGACPKRPFLYKIRYERALKKYRAMGHNKTNANKLARVDAGTLCYVNGSRGGAGTSTNDHKRIEIEKIPLLMEIESIEEMRLGGWGNPSSMARATLEKLLKVLAKTGKRRMLYISYDQWNKPENQWLKNYCMASVDSPKQYARAVAMGWKSYRVRQIGEPLLDGEEMCPASAENAHAETCTSCPLKCNGTASAAIFDHGSTSEIRKVSARLKKMYKGQLVNINKLAKQEIIQKHLDAMAQA